MGDHAIAHFERALRQQPELHAATGLLVLLQQFETALQFGIGLFQLLPVLAVLPQQMAAFHGAQDAVIEYGGNEGINKEVIHRPSFMAATASSMS